MVDPTVPADPVIHADPRRPADSKVDSADKPIGLVVGPADKHVGPADKHVRPEHRTDESSVGSDVGPEWAVERSKIRSRPHDVELGIYWEISVNDVTSPSYRGERTKGTGNGINNLHGSKDEMSGQCVLTILRSANRNLEGAVSKEGSKEAVWDCGSDKSPGTGGDFRWSNYRLFTELKVRWRNGETTILGRYLDGSSFEALFLRIYALNNIKDATICMKLTELSLDNNFRRSIRGEIELSLFKSLTDCSFRSWLNRVLIDGSGL
ncbi:hypothetical protein Tco_0740710 [Tanacetum coccineum]